MATRRAIANGNWSSTSTWNGGVVPGNGDTVYSNGFIIQLDVDINIGGANNPIVNAGSFVSGQWYQITSVGTTNFAGIGATSNTLGVIFLASGVGSGTGQAQALATLTTATNTAAGATGGGGQFNMSATYNMTCDLRAAATVCLNVTGATNMTLSGLRIIGGATIGGHGLNYAGTGTVTVTSSTLSGGSSNGAAINNASTGSIVVSGSTLASGQAGQASAIINASTGNVSVSSSTVSAANVSAVVLNNASTGTITVSGSTITAGNTNAHGISNVMTGTVTVSESTLTAGNSTTAYAILNTSAGTVTVTSSDIVASAFSNAIVGASITAVVNLSGSFYDHWQGMPAVYVAKWKLGTAPTLGQHRFALAGTTDSYYTMYGADNGAFGNPIAANVRSGIVYGGGNITGTLAVPLPSQVAVGVATDNTVGTAALSANAVAAAVWSAASRTITEGGITAADVWSHASRTITGGTPTASEIAAEVWAKPTTELTTTGSIGERAKNQSTVSTTGAQLAAALS